MSGIIKRADAEANIFLIIVGDKDSQTHYVIGTLPETLNKSVKAYCGEVVKVYIQPKAHEGQECEYELIEVKMD